LYPTPEHLKKKKKTNRKKNKKKQKLIIEKKPQIEKKMSKTLPPGLEGTN